MASRSDARADRAPGRRALCALSAAAAVALACSGSPMEAPPPPTPEQQFDALWADFDAVYPYFTPKGVDWDAARASFRPRAAAARSEQELAAVLGELLAPLRDIHVVLLRPDGRPVPTWNRSYVPNFDPTVWAAYASRWNVVSRGVWGHGWIGAVPYVYVDAWSAPLDGFDVVFESFRGAPGLVLDLRMNGGGNSSYAIPLATRLADRTRDAFRIRWRNGPGHDDFTAWETAAFSPGGAWQFTSPVLVLLGPRSASSTEDLASALRELPHVSLVGDTTAGGSGNPATRELAEGWGYRVSRWWFETPDGIVVEGNGLPPHKKVPAGPDDFATGVDPVLDFAERWAANPVILRGP